MLHPHRSATSLRVAFVVALAGATSFACDKNGASPGVEQGEVEPTATTPPTSPQAQPQEPGEPIQPPAEPALPGAGAQPDQPGPPGPGAQGGGQAMNEAMAACPMMVEGVTVDVEDTTDGVALRFTTASGDVEDLRGRVERIARMYETHAGHGPMMWHHMGHGAAEATPPGAQGGTQPGAQPGVEQPGMGGTIPAATVRVEPLDNGARLVLVPQEPGQLDALRQQVREHQRRMTSHECPAPQA